MLAFDDPHRRRTESDGNWTAGTYRYCFPQSVGSALCQKTIAYLYEQRFTLRRSGRYATKVRDCGRRSFGPARLLNLIQSEPSLLRERKERARFCFTKWKAFSKQVQQRNPSAAVAERHGLFHQRVTILESMRRTVVNFTAWMPDHLRQAILGTAVTQMPGRLSNLGGLLYVTVRDLLKCGSPLVPNPDCALESPDGLCGLAGRLDLNGLIAGYRSGMFVFNHIGPLKRWSPRQRMVLFFDRARLEKSTRRALHKRRFRFTFDHAFHDVMEACARPRSGQTPLTWITPQVQKLFSDAIKCGFAHGRTP